MHLLEISMGWSLPKGSRMARCLRAASWIVGVYVATASYGFAQLDKTPDKTLGEPTIRLPEGSEQIKSGKVTGTISFLASDELAGRETNSKEFEIAAA
ncbi:MAG: hypothetical protein ACK480_17345 [Planctomycetota bacterium]